MAVDISLLPFGTSISHSHKQCPTLRAKYRYTFCPCYNLQNLNQRNT